MEVASAALVELTTAPEPAPVPASAPKPARTKGRDLARIHGDKSLMVRTICDLGGRMSRGHKVHCFNAGAHKNGDRNASGNIFQRKPDGAWVYKCHSCSARGDVIDLTMQLHGCTFAEAVDRLNGAPAPTSPAAVKAAVSGVVVAAAGGGDPKKSVATKIIELCNDRGVELFHNGDRAFASIIVNEHRETHKVPSAAFRRWLGREYYAAYQKAPNAAGVSDAMNVLAAKATHDGPELPVAVRVAEHGGDFYLDLADESWRAIKVTRDGWRVVDAPPVRFLRPRGVRALPCPEQGGALQELRELLNLQDDDDWALALAWLVAALRPTGPYPVLALSGEQGSGKTGACKHLRKIIDPNDAELRAEPRDPRDLIIAATNGWCVALDNVSKLDPQLSDSICRLATGGGLATRELYSDAEETIFSACRPVLLNGIGNVARRSDLLDRSIALTLPTIDEDRRLPEADLNRRFDDARPRILGALLDAVSAAMKRLPSIRLNKLPRMADFALWAVAAEPALGLPDGAFLRAYWANIGSANEAAIEAHPVGPVLLVFMESRETWCGTSGELLESLKCPSTVKHDWPQSPQALSAVLRRLAPNLRRAGVDVKMPEGRKGRNKSRLIEMQTCREDRPQEPHGSTPPASEPESRLFDSEGGPMSVSADRSTPPADGSTPPEGGPMSPEGGPMSRKADRSTLNRDSEAETAIAAHAAHAALVPPTFADCDSAVAEDGAY